MRYRVLTLAVLSAALVSTPASAEPVVLKPSSPWNVDFADNKCRLARLFGEGDNSHLVFFEQYWPSESFGLTVAGPSYKRIRDRQPTELRFSESQPVQRSEPFTGTVVGYGKGVIYSSIKIGPDADTEEQDARTTGLSMLDTGIAGTVEFVGLKQSGDEIRLLTGPLDKAFDVLNQCTSGLLAEWGLDPEQQRSATRLPQWTNIGPMVRRIQESYPIRARHIGEQGIMRMRVIVSAEGRVEDCAIIKATNTDRLESPACNVMKDAIFEPGLDAAGKPFRSLYVTSITYRLG